MAIFWKRKEAPPEFAIPGGAPAPPAPDDAASPEAEKVACSAAAATVEEPVDGLFGKVRTALSDKIRRTKEDIVGQIRAAVKAAGKVDEHLIERIEEILIKADVGAETTMRIVDEMKEFEARGASPDELLISFKDQLHNIIGHKTHSLGSIAAKPQIILVIGVNGVGKTTTIGKLAAEYQAKDRKTMVVAGDTFRAAAVEQLHIWAERTKSGFISRPMGADPAGLCFDAIQQAQADGTDVVLIDTAGRLHTKTNLMEELKKVVRVIQKQIPNAPHEVLLVLDATTGQNAIQQAKVFTEAIPVTGLVMTKLDGTAKGGVLIGIRNLFDVPIVKIGVGESVDDLRNFNPREFVDALFAE